MDLDSPTPAPAADEAPSDTAPAVSHSEPAPGTKLAPGTEADSGQGEGEGAEAVDRSRTPPTLLRIFVCRQTHHPTKALNDRASTAPTPPEVHLYTWKDATMAEVLRLLDLPSPAPATTQDHAQDHPHPPTQPQTATERVAGKGGIGWTAQTKVAVRLIYADAGEFVHKDLVSLRRKRLPRPATPQPPLSQAQDQTETQTDTAQVNGNAEDGLLEDEWTIVDAEDDQRPLKSLDAYNWLPGDFLSLAIIHPHPHSHTQASHPHHSNHHARPYPNAHRNDRPPPRGPLPRGPASRGPLPPPPTSRGPARGSPPRPSYRRDDRPPAPSGPRSARPFDQSDRPAFGRTFNSRGGFVGRPGGQSPPRRPRYRSRSRSRSPRR